MSIGRSASFAHRAVGSSPVHLVRARVRASVGVRVRVGARVRVGWG